MGMPCSLAGAVAFRICYQGAAEQWTLFERLFEVVFPCFLLEYAVRYEFVIVIEQDLETIEVVEDHDRDGEGFGVVFVAGGDVDAVEEVFLELGIVDEDFVDLMVRAETSLQLERFWFWLNCRA